MAPPLFGLRRALASDVPPVSACTNSIEPFTLPNAPEVVNATGVSLPPEGGQEGVGPYALVFTTPAPLIRYGGDSTGPTAMRSGPGPPPMTSAVTGAALPSVMNSWAEP